MLNTVPQSEKFLADFAAFFASSLRPCTQRASTDAAFTMATIPKGRQQKTVHKIAHTK